MEELNIVWSNHTVEYPAAIKKSQSGYVFPDTKLFKICC